MVGDWAKFKADQMKLTNYMKWEVTVNSPGSVSGSTMKRTRKGLGGWTRSMTTVKYTGALVLGSVRRGYRWGLSV